MRTPSNVAALCKLFPLQLLIFRKQHFCRFDMLRIFWNAIHGTHHLALRLIKMSYTFRAQIRINFVNQFALENRFVRTRRFAHIAVDAFVRNHQRHDFSRNFFATTGATNALTSPPIAAISRTSEAET